MHFSSDKLGIISAPIRCLELSREYISPIHHGCNSSTRQGNPTFEGDVCTLFALDMVGEGGNVGDVGEMAESEVRLWICGCNSRAGFRELDFGISVCPEP